MRLDLLTVHGVCTMVCMQQYNLCAAVRTRSSILLVITKCLHPVFDRVTLTELSSVKTTSKFITVNGMQAVSCDLIDVEE